MPQLDKFTYFTQFFWSCLFLFTFYIPICKKDILRKGFSIGLSYIYSFLFTFYIPISIGLSYMYSSLFEVAQWCNDFLRKCVVFYVVSRRDTFLFFSFIRPLPRGADPPLGRSWWCRRPSCSREGVTPGPQRGSAPVSGTRSSTQADRGNSSGSQISQRGAKMLGGGGTGFLRTGSSALP